MQWMQCRCRVGHLTSPHPRRLTGILQEPETPTAYRTLHVLFVVDDSLDGWRAVDASDTGLRLSCLKCQSGGLDNNDSPGQAAVGPAACTCWTQLWSHRHHHYMYMMYSPPSRLQVQVSKDTANKSLQTLHI